VKAFTVAIAALLWMMAPVALTSLDKGSQSNIDDGRQVSIRTESDWTRLWQQHKPDRPKPTVDFSKQMVLGVFMGSRSTGGFAVEILGASETGGALTVQYRETIPQPGAITAQVISAPYHLVAVPKVTGTVTFEKVR
jgi:hypothetical protein